MSDKIAVTRKTSATCKTVRAVLIVACMKGGRHSRLGRESDINEPRVQQIKTRNVDAHGRDHHLLAQA